MATRLPMHRGIVVAVHAMILAVMLAIFIGVGTFSEVHPGVWMPILLVPIMVAIWSIVDIDRKARILGYWGLALLMSPIAVMGVFGGWGLLYLIGIIFLLWAAWMENEGR